MKNKHDIIIPIVGILILCLAVGFGYQWGAEERQEEYTRGYYNGYDLGYCEGGSLQYLAALSWWEGGEKPDIQELRAHTQYKCQVEPGNFSAMRFSK